MINIFSVIVLYNPNPENILNLGKISQLSKKLFIIDNSNLISTLKSIEDQNSIVYIKNESNIGLAKALNIGIKFCLEDKNCTHIALFDQDSVPDALMFERMTNYLENCDPNLVAVCPEIVDVKNVYKPSIHSAEKIDIAITSGTLFVRKAFKDVGLMDETFFIDYIDYEWCLRAKSKNFDLVRVNGAILNHNMGDTFVNVFGMSKPLHANKMRHYYIIRNQLIFISRSYIPLKYRITHFLKLFYRIPAYLFFSDNKISSGKLIVSAIIDFIKKRKEYQTIRY
jgi:rhamnosyltransferase